MSGPEAVAPKSITHYVTLFTLTVPQTVTLIFKLIFAHLAHVNTSGTGKKDMENLVDDHNIKHRILDGYDVGVNCETMQREGSAWARDSVAFDISGVGGEDGDQPYFVASSPYL